MPIDHSESKGILSQNLQEKALKSIRSGQEPLWDDPLMGLIIDPSKDEFLSSIQSKSIKHNIPLSSFMDDTHFNLGTLRRALVTLVYEMIELGMLADHNHLSLLKQLNSITPELVNNFLKGNSENLEDLAKRLEVSPLVLSFIVSSLLQPSMIYLASISGREYLDAWEQNICPICGRLASLVVKSEEEVWRFRCSYCRAEYKMDIFKCPNCGSEGSENKDFLLVGMSHEFEIASCSGCNHYYKIINEAKLREPILEGFEDLRTEILDEIAHERGLKRLDETIVEA